MVVPDFQSMMLPLLNCLADKQEWPVFKIRAYLASEFNLEYEDISQLKPSGSETTLANRTNWCRFYLKNAGLITNPRPGFSQITDEGMSVVQNPPDKVNKKYLRRFPQFNEFMSKISSKSPKNETESSDDSDQSPEDKLSEGYVELKDAVQVELLNILKNMEPTSFENLVLLLFKKMGYGGIIHTGQSRDGGIDGIIKQDALGLDEISVQAKRYTTASVPTEAVRGFDGALNRASHRGIFVTTSTFTQDAISHARTSPNRIALIDGQYLTSLMFEYGVGVVSGDTYQIKTVDADFFSTI